MAVIVEVTLRGITPEQYDAVRERVGWVERPPEGGIAHLTWWEGEDCHNLDGWASEEAFGAFGEGRLAPAMAELGIDTPPIAVFHPAHEVYTPEAGIVAATELPNRAAAGNADIARAGYAAFAAGDIPTVLGLFADDLVWTTPDSVPFGGVYSGPQGAAEFFTKLPQNFAELRVEPQRFIEAGDTVVVPGRHRGRTVAGNAFDVPFVHVWSYRNGKVTAFTEVMDSAPVVAALAPDAESMLRRMFDEIINEGRLEVADELFAEDFVDHGPMGDISGRETFKQLVAQWRDAVPDVHCEISDVVAQGELCVWFVRTTGTHTGGGLGFPATGKRFETLSANIGRFRDGRAAEHWSEQGLFPMLVQVGVIPVPVPAAG
ncbi:MAG: nuclear transport factor 2 family protein [Leifsonia sp.]